MILCISEGDMPFKMHKIIFFAEKNKQKIFVCLL